MQTGESQHDEERARRLSAIESELQELTLSRLALPGGLGDAVLRDRVDDLESERDLLRTQLGM